MDEIIKPSVQAFLVCDQVISDSATGKKTVVGAFTHIWATNFPCRHHKLGIYLCITDAEGDYVFEIQLVYLNTNQIVGRATMPKVTINDRLDINDYGINIPYTDFPAVGRYEFRLYANGTFITQKDFNVIQSSGGP